MYPWLWLWLHLGALNPTTRTSTRRRLLSYQYQIGPKPGSSTPVDFQPMRSVKVAAQKIKSVSSKMHSMRSFILLVWCTTMCWKRFLG
ncbi:hypothetical protein BKA64DRAFT_659523 [Cadophora sp. MPI-SDFR-AT-0126]|nr:hypothetical protein BKA64DRAFT_659523 [Leotiomycetes sp. MPI-SDFR-AT-0126]